MADQIKQNVGSVFFEPDEDVSATVKGRNLTTGLPCSIEISRSMLYDCIMKETEQIITAVKEVIEKTPPELVGDIYTNGITMTGGGSLLHGMDKLIENRPRFLPALRKIPLTASQSEPENPLITWTSWLTALLCRPCRGFNHAGF